MTFLRNKQLRKAADRRRHAQAARFLASFTRTLSPTKVAKILGITLLFKQTLEFDQKTGENVLKEHNHKLSLKDQKLCANVAKAVHEGGKLPEGCTLVSIMDTKKKDEETGQFVVSGKRIVIETTILRPASAMFLPRDNIPSGAKTLWRPNNVNGSSPQRVVHTPELYLKQIDEESVYLTIFCDTKGVVSNCFAGGDPPSQEVQEHESALKNRFHGNLSAVLTRLVDCERMGLPVPPALIEEVKQNGDHMRALFSTVMIRLDE